MKDEILDIIRYIKAEKNKRGIVPGHALSVQLFTVLRQRFDITLSEMVADGTIQKCETVNDVAYFEKLS
jgi:hypothetical protein